jgi:8-oxo-dGTP pyrophosphatase MutT (NUDIX family)
VKQSGIVLVTRLDDRILVVTNRRYGGWCLPGGKVDPDETPRAAAARELQEETESIVLPEDLVWLTAGTSATESGREVHMFYARSIIGNPRTVEQGTEVGWMTYGELIATFPFGRFYVEHLPDGIAHLKPTVLR